MIRQREKISYIVIPNAQTSLEGEKASFSSLSTSGANQRAGKSSFEIEIGIEG